MSYILRQKAPSEFRNGFTIVEVTIVIVAAGLIFGLVFSFFWQYWQFAEKAQSDSDVLTERLDTSDYIREIVGTSSGLITQNSIIDSNANVVDGTAGAGYWLTIHSVPQTTATTSSDQPILYFKRFSQNSSKAFIMNGTSPYEDQYVIYLSNNGELRVRTLKNTAATGNILTTSCPPTVATSTCPADKVLIKNVESIGARYFSRSGNLIDYTPYYDSDAGVWVNGPDFPVVEVVEYTIKVSKAAFTQTTNTTQSETIIRIALRNT